MNLLLKIQTNGVRKAALLFCMENFCFAKKCFVNKRVHPEELLKACQGLSGLSRKLTTVIEFVTTCTKLSKSTEIF